MKSHPRGLALFSGGGGVEQRRDRGSCGRSGREGPRRRAPAKGHCCDFRGSRVVFSFGDWPKLELELAAILPLVRFQRLSATPFDLLNASTASALSDRRRPQGNPTASDQTNPPSSPFPSLHNHPDAPSLPFKSSRAASSLRRIPPSPAKQPRRPNHTLLTHIRQNSRD